MLCNIKSPVVTVTIMCTAPYTNLEVKKGVLFLSQVTHEHNPRVLQNTFLKKRVGNVYQKVNLYVFSCLLQFTSL